MCAVFRFPLDAWLCVTARCPGGSGFAAMQQLSDQFPRLRYRRILVFMEQLGHAIGPDKTLRLWQKAGLQVPRKRPRKRVAHSRPRPQLPSGANEVWAYDFVHDACANGQQLKCITIIDEYTKECLAIDVAGSIRSLSGFHTKAFSVARYLLAWHMRLFSFRTNKDRITYYAWRRHGLPVPHLAPFPQDSSLAALRLSIK